MPPHSNRFLRVALILLAVGIVFVISEFNPIRKMEKDIGWLFETSNELNSLYAHLGNYPKEYDTPKGYFYRLEQDSFYLKAPTGLTAAGKNGKTEYVGDIRRANPSPK